MSAIPPMSSRPSVVDESDPLAPLGLPGVARALKAFDQSTIEDILSNALRSGRPHLAAMLLRDLGCEPAAIRLEVADAPNPNSNQYSLERTKFDISMWGRISDALKMGPANLDREDWMTFFEVSARALEGKERARGMATVIYALRRLDARDEAIERFPALFRSARNSKSKTSAFGVMATRSAFDTEAIEILIPTLERLKKTKLKEQPADLITAAASANAKVREAFAAIFGQEALVNARDEHGKTALFHAATNVSFNGAIEWLITHGADPMARAGNNQTVLQHMTVAQSPATSVAELLRCAEYPASHLKETIEECGWRLTPDVSALLQAQLARLTMADIANASRLSAQRSSSGPG